MVAAGSVVAAVQGLHPKSPDASLSSQNLTNLLSQVIGSDPVCRQNLIQHENLSFSFFSCVFIFSQDCLRACQEQIESLLESSLRQAQHYSSSTEPKCGSGDADLSCTPTDVRDINIWNSWQRRRLMDFQQKGAKVVTGGSASCWCQCALRWRQHERQGFPGEKQWQLMASVGSSWRYNICLYIFLLL